MDRLEEIKKLLSLYNLGIQAGWASDVYDLLNEGGVRIGSIYRADLTSFYKGLFAAHKDISNLDDCPYDMYGKPVSRQRFATYIQGYGLIRSPDEDTTCLYKNPKEPIILRGKRIRFFTCKTLD